MKYASLIIVAVCALLFALELAYPSSVSDFILDRSQLLEKPWMIVTHMFLHGSFEHLFYNMFALGIFGFVLENIIGTKRFLAVYFIAGLISALGSLPFYEASLGASGAIFGILGCLAFMRPKMMVWVLGVPMPMIAAAAVWILIDLVGVFFPTNTANVAHIIGMLCGIAAGAVMKKNFSDSIKPKYDIDEQDMEEWEEQWM